MALAYKFHIPYELGNCTMPRDPVAWLLRREIGGPSIRVAEHGNSKIPKQPNERRVAALRRNNLLILMLACQTRLVLDNLMLKTDNFVYKTKKNTNEVVDLMWSSSNMD